MCARERRTHRVLASSSLSIVFCLRSSSIRVVVTSFSLSFDSLVAIGGVTPRYLLQIVLMILIRSVHRQAYLWLLSICNVVYTGEKQRDLVWAINLSSKPEVNSNRSEKVASAISMCVLMSSSEKIDQTKIMYSTTIDRDSSKW